MYNAILFNGKQQADSKVGPRQENGNHVFFAIYHQWRVKRLIMYFYQLLFFFHGYEQRTQRQRRQEKYHRYGGYGGCGGCGNQQLDNMKIDVTSDQRQAVSSIANSPGSELKNSLARLSSTVRKFIKALVCHAIAQYAGIDTGTEHLHSLHKLTPRRSVQLQTLNVIVWNNKSRVK